MAAGPLALAWAAPPGRPGAVASAYVLAAATSPALSDGRATQDGPAALASFSPGSVTYVSASEGWALGTVACGRGRCLMLVHTANDGASWSAVPVPPAGPEEADSTPLKVRFADPADGWIFSALPGQGKVQAWSTHSGGRRWSAISFPVKNPSSIGLEDIEAAAGVVDAALQVGDEVQIFSAPVDSNNWHRAGAAYQLGAGPVPSGELALQGRSGWFVQNDRVVVSGGRKQPSGAWASWQPPCSSAGGPAVLAAPTASRVDAVCTEGVWTGRTVTVDLLPSTNGGTSFGPSRPVPVGSADMAAATGTSTVAVGALVNGNNSSDVTLEMSFNSGTSWRSVYRHAGAGWLELGFTTAQQGVAIVLGPQDHASHHGQRQALGARRLQITREAALSGGHSL
jgi:hypothetical protein